MIAKSNRLSRLTRIELKILTDILNGQLRKITAYNLGVSEAVIKNHTSSILKKLNVNNRTAAASLVYKDFIEHIANGVEFPQEEAQLFLNSLNENYDEVRV